MIKELFVKMERKDGYLKFLAKVWKLFYKDDVPVLGKAAVKALNVSQTPPMLNVSYFPVNTDVDSTSQPLPVILLDEIIRKSPHRVITKTCTCREAKQCKNYDYHIGCIHIGEPTKQEPDTVAYHVSAEEAIAHVHKAVDLGLYPFVGHAGVDNLIWGVDLDKPFLTVCFCCPCCCLNMHGYKSLTEENQSNYHRLKGVHILVDEDKCIGCGKCAEKCFANAIDIVGGKCVIFNYSCKNCGVCAQICPQKAITVQVDDIQQTIDDFLYRVNDEVGGLPLDEYKFI